MSGAEQVHVNSKTQRGGPSKWKCEECRKNHKPCTYVRPIDDCDRCQNRKSGTCGRKETTTGEPHPDYNGVDIVAQIPRSQPSDLLVLLSHHMKCTEEKVVDTILKQFVKTKEDEQYACESAQRALSSNNPPLDPAHWSQHELLPEEQLEGNQGSGYYTGHDGLLVPPQTVDGKYIWDLEANWGCLDLSSRPHIQPQCAPLGEPANTRDPISNASTASLAPHFEPREPQPLQIDHRIPPQVTVPLPPEYQSWQQSIYCPVAEMFRDNPCSPPTVHQSAFANSSAAVPYLQSPGYLGSARVQLHRDPATTPLQMGRDNSSPLLDANVLAPPAQWHENYSDSLSGYLWSRPSA